MQQQQQHLMHPTMATYYNNNNSFTTDHIQQYLDENKALILRIVEGQNTGKINECAENQARLQRNLMYLAAIADAQPHPSTAMHSQQAAYYAQSQATSPQAFMASRSSMLYNQQTLNPQVGMSSIGSSGFSILQGEADTSAGLSGFGLADGCVDGSTGLHLKSRVDEK